MDMVKSLFGYFVSPEDPAEDSTVTVSDDHLDNTEPDLTSQTRNSTVTTNRYKAVRKGPMYNKKTLMAALSKAKAEREEDRERALRVKAELEEENSELMYHVHKLTGAVKQLEEILYEADVAHCVLERDRERAKEANRSLMEELNKTVKQRDALLKEKMKQKEAYRRLKAQYNDQQQRINVCDMLLGKVQKASRFKVAS